MGSHHRYKPRDFDLSHLLVTLRRKAGLTQEELALSTGVAVKSIRNWEGGIHYPSATNLQKLLELYLHRNALTPGQEQEEASTLWEMVRERAPHRIGSFDERWFAVLRQQWQERPHHNGLLFSDNQQPVARDQHPSKPLSSLTPSTQAFSSSLPLPPPGNVSEVPNVPAFYGRTDELAELERWLVTERCRLVAILGMGGIGKTALTVKLIEQVGLHFRCILWSSLQNAPPLETLVSDWLSALSEGQDRPSAQGIEHDLNLLIRFLQQRRCLVVLDNLETLFLEGLPEGRYRQGYEGYATFLRRMAETTHQSCLLLTCREKFPELGILTGEQAPVRLLRLGGLARPACQQLLQQKGLFGDQMVWSELAQRYAGNPLALKIVAEVVAELFGGDIAAFLAEGFTTFHGIRQLLDQQFERLSSLCQTLMYWIAIEREGISLETLQKDLSHPVTKSELLEAMHALCSRDLVERAEHGAGFLLQPVILEYVAERLVTLVSQELRENQPALLLTHALLQSQAKDYIRASQAQLLLQPVLDRLFPHPGSQEDLEERLARLLQQLRALPHAAQGYGGGNLVNLLVRLNGHVRGQDCSDLTIWQADLREAETQGANFTGADLTGSAFMEPLEGTMSVALSANGQYFAAGTLSGQIYLWRVMDGQLLLTLRGHVRLIWSLVFHPESRLLVSGGHDGLVKVWEVSSGQGVHILQGHTRGVRSVAIHPEGKLLATCSDDGSIRLWDLTAGHCLEVWYQQREGIWSVAFSPDGKLLASGDADGVVRVWDLEPQHCRWSIATHQGSMKVSPHGVRALAFGPDSTLLASGGEDARILLWRAHSGEPLNTLIGHTGQVASVAFPAEGLLASGGQDRTIKLWKVEAGGEAAHCVETLRNHSIIWSIARGSREMLVSGHRGGVVKLWHIQEKDGRGKCLRTLQGYSRQIDTVALNQNGTILVSSEHNGITRQWETGNGRCLRILTRQIGGASGTAFCPDGRFFAHSSFNKTIGIWDGESGQYLRTLQGHQGEIWSVAFSSDGCFLLSCSMDTTVKRWEVASGRCLTTLQGHKDWVWSVASSPDGLLLASGDIDGVIKLWEAESGRCLRTWQGSSKAIVALAFASDGRTLLSSSEEHIVAVWDIQSEHCLRTIPGSGETYWLRSVAYSVDGSLLAATSRDQTVKIWDVNSGDLLRTLPCYAGGPYSVAWSTDQHLLACGTDEGSILLFEWQTGTCVQILRGERPYERMNISGVTGVTEAQKASLKALGAIEESSGR